MCRAYMVSGALAAKVKKRFSRRKNAFSLIRLWRTKEIFAAPCGRAFFYLPGSAHRGSLSAAATHAPRRVTPDGGSLRDVEFDAALDSRHGRKLAVARS